MNKQNTNFGKNRSKSLYDDLSYVPIDEDQERLDDFLQACMEAYWQKLYEHEKLWQEDEIWAPENKL